MPGIHGSAVGVSALFPSGGEELEALRSTALSSSWLAGGQTLAVRPVVLDRRFEKELVADCTRLQELMRSLLSRVFGGDVRRFAGAAGLTDAEAATLVAMRPPDPLEDPGLLPTKWDYVVEEGGPRILEMNCSMRIGGINLDPVQHVYDLLGHRGDSTWPRASALWAAALQRRTGPWSAADAVALAEADDYRDIGSYSAIQLANCLSQATRAGLVPCRAHELDISDSGLRCGNQRIDHLVEMIPHRKFARHAHLRAYADAVARGRITPTVSIWSDVLASKAVLALLHENLGAFAAADAGLVGRLVPWTARLAVADPALLRERRAELVLKPGRLLDGKDVVLGADCPPGEWLARCEALAARDPAAVVQGRVEHAEALPQTWVRPDGRTFDGNARPVLSLVVLDGEAAGGTARFAPTGTGVVSVAFGGAGKSVVRVRDGV